MKSYVQAFGRAGRDGQNSESLLLFHGRQLCLCEPEMLDFFLVFFGDSSSVLTRILHLGVQGPIKTKKVGHLRDRLGRYGIQMYWYIDGIGRQLNNVIFDHSLIITEINFNNTLSFTLYT